MHLIGKIDSWAANPQEVGLMNNPDWPEIFRDLKPNRRRGELPPLTCGDTKVERPVARDLRSSFRRLSVFVWRESIMSMEERPLRDEFAKAALSGLLTLYDDGYPESQGRKKATRRSRRTRHDRLYHSGRHGGRSEQVRRLRMG